MSMGSVAPSTALVLRPKRAETNSFAALLPLMRTMGDVLALGLILVVFLRSSVLPSLLPLSQKYWFYATYLALLLSLAYLLFKKEWSLYLPGFAFSVSVLFSCVVSPLREDALLKGMGFLVLFWVLGPGLRGSAFARFRSTAWSACNLSMIAVGLLSAIWYFAGLPLLGMGFFSGVMWHCMLTSPFSAMALLLLVIRAFRGRSIYWAAAGLVCLVPTLAAGSRTAIISLIAAALLLIWFLSTRYRGVILAIFLVLVIARVSGLDSRFFREDAPGGKWTATMRHKGTVNTRAELWAARIYEFRARPVFGMGIGIGEGAGFVQTSGGVNIEPGSSYLALLSMTGLLGALSFLAFCIALIQKMRLNMPRIDFWNRIELIVILVYMLVHAISEGWLLGVGSPLAVVFWLAMGRALDLSLEAGASRR